MKERKDPYVNICEGKENPYVKRTEKEDDAYPPLTEMNICSHLLLMYVTS